MNCWQLRTGSSRRGRKEIEPKMNIPVSPLDNISFYKIRRMPLINMAVYQTIISLKEINKKKINLIQIMT